MFNSADTSAFRHETRYALNVQLRYNYRLYPTPGQVRALARLFGCARVVFNDALRARKAAHEAGLPYVTDAELSAQLAVAKKTPERAWLGEVSSVPCSSRWPISTPRTRTSSTRSQGTARARRWGRRG